MTSIGWTIYNELDEGIEKTYSWFLENIKTIKEVKMYESSTYNMVVTGTEMGLI